MQTTQKARERHSTKRTTGRPATTAHRPPESPSASLNPSGNCATARHTNVTQIPNEGLLRLKQILGDPKAEPPIPPIIPISRTAWFEGQKNGRFPKPVAHFGVRIAVYSTADIRALLAGKTDFTDVTKEPTRPAAK